MNRACHRAILSAQMCAPRWPLEAVKTECTRNWQWYHSKRHDTPLMKVICRSSDRAATATIQPISKSTFNWLVISGCATEQLGYRIMRGTALVSLSFE